MTTKIRVLLADEYAMIRDGLEHYLNGQEGIEVIAIARDGMEAVAECKRLQPNVAVIDSVMHGLNGIDATAQIREACPKVQVVIMSTFSNVDYVHRALSAGALGYVAKTSSADELAQAVFAVHAGRRFLSGPITQSLIDGYLRGRTGKNPIEQLSMRERQILQLIAEGRSSASIAQLLSLSPKTVDTYRSRIMEKLGINEIAALIKFAIRHGITPPE